MNKFISIFLIVCLTSNVFGDSLLQQKDTDNRVNKRETPIKAVLGRTEQMLESTIDTWRGIINGASNLPPPFNTIISAKGMPLIDAMEKVLDALRGISSAASGGGGGDLFGQFKLPGLPSLPSLSNLINQ